MNTYNIEVTDTFGDEANYSWVRRYTYKARSFRGAINQLAKQHGAGWRKLYDCGDMAQYKLTGACIVCFVTIED